MASSVPAPSPSPDPFADPSTPSPAPTPEPNRDLDTSDLSASVLTVDRTATLTLGTDALILLDESLRQHRSPATFCGLLPQLANPTRAIPFHNILSADLSAFELSIKYASATSKKACAVAYIHYTLPDKTQHAHAERWVAALLARAYPPGTIRRPRIKVLVNPFGGQGYAAKMWTREVEPVFAAAGCDVDVERTAHKGHAREIAAALDVDAYDVVACASGDGLPHEVFNGLAAQREPARALREVAVVQIPCGSGNAMSLNLNGTDSPSWAAVAIVKGLRAPLDLVAITQGEHRFYSFLSQSLGLIAESDLGTENLRWMGSFRFTWGVIVRLLGKSVYPTDIAYDLETDDKSDITARYHRTAALHTSETPSPPPFPTLSHPTFPLPPLTHGTITSPLPATFTITPMPTLGNFYAGNMRHMSPDTPFFPAALPSDALLDLITIDGTLPRHRGVAMLLKVADGALMGDRDVAYRKVRAYRITPRPAPGSATGDLEAGGVGAACKGGWRSRWRDWVQGSDAERGEGYISIDGERVPFAPFQAEVCARLGTVLTRRAGVYEGSGGLV